MFLINRRMERLFSETFWLNAHLQFFVPEWASIFAILWSVANWAENSVR